MGYYTSEVFVWLNTLISEIARQIEKNILVAHLASKTNRLCNTTLRPIGAEDQCRILQKRAISAQRSTNDLSNDTIINCGLESK